MSGDAQDGGAGLLVDAREGGLAGGDLDAGGEGCATAAAAVAVGVCVVGRCLELLEIDTSGDWGGRDDYEGEDHFLQLLGQAVEMAGGLGWGHRELLGGVGCGCGCGGRIFGHVERAWWIALEICS